MLKTDVLQVFVGAASVFGIGLIWINFNEKVFKTIRHLISAPFTWREEEPFYDEHVDSWKESHRARAEEEIYDKVINRMAPP